MSWKVHADVAIRRPLARRLGRQDGRTSKWTPCQGVHRLFRLGVDFVSVSTSSRVDVRREWDSNPRRLAPRSFSRAVHSSALPSLQVTHGRCGTDAPPTPHRRPTGSLASRARQRRRPGGGLVQDPSAQPDRLWRHIDVLALGDELQRVLQGEGQTRLQTSPRALLRCCGSSRRVAPMGGRTGIKKGNRTH